MVANQVVAVTRYNTRIDQALTMVEAEIARNNWATASAVLSGATKELYAAEQTYQSKGMFVNLRDRAKDLETKIKVSLSSNQRLIRFRALRAESGYLVLGLAGIDLKARWRKTQDVVRNALELFGANPDTGKDPNLADPNLDAAEKKEIREGCCEMLLGLAELVVELDPAEAGDRDRALPFLEQANRVCPAKGAYYSRRARCLARLGQDMEAKEQKKLAESSTFNEAFEAYLRGTDLYLDGDLAGAVKAFEAAVVRDPNHAGAHYACAIAYVRLRQQAGQAPRAREFLLAANMSLSVCIRQQPGIPWPFLVRGIVRHELSLTSDAESDFRDAEKLLPSDYPAARYALLVTRGSLRIGAGKVPGAISDLTEAVKIRPHDYQARLNLQRAYQLQGQKEKALGEMDQAIKDNAMGPAPVKALLYRTRARLHQEAGRNSAAMDDLAKSARLETAPAMAAEDLLARGKLLAQTEDYAGAVLAFSAALAAQPDHPGVLQARAEALLRLQREQEALRDLNVLLEGDRGRQPGTGPLFRARAGIRAKTGDHQGAIDDYTYALAAEPATGPAAMAAHCGRGWSYLAMDAALLAQADFDQALRLAPADGAAHNGLAQAQLKLGRFKDAADSAEQALKLGPAERTPAQQCSHVLDAARVFAQLSLKAAEQAGVNSQRGKDVGLAYQNRAIGLIRDAVMTLPAPERKKVWSTTIERDRAWNPIRECKGFLELAGEVGQAEPPPLLPSPGQGEGRKPQN